MVQRKKETVPQIVDDPQSANLGRYGFVSSDGDLFATQLGPSHRHIPAHQGDGRLAFRETTRQLEGGHRHSHGHFHTGRGAARASRSALNSHCFTSDKTAKQARHERFQPTSARSGIWGTSGRADARTRAPGWVRTDCMRSPLRNAVKLAAGPRVAAEAAVRWRISTSISGVSSRRRGGAGLGFNIHFVILSWIHSQ